MHTKIWGIMRFTDKTGLDKTSFYNLHEGHRQRFREKIIDAQWENLTEHQLMEFVLSVVIPRRDTNPLAHRLVDYFGSLANVLDASVEDLMQVNGVGKVTATFLHGIPSIFKAYKKSKQTERAFVGNATNVYRYFGDTFRHMPAEEFHLICADSQSKLIVDKLIAKGSNTEVAFTVKSVMETAVRHKASGVVLLHNHPNGDTSPSAEDIEMTKQIYYNLMLNGIHVLDHIIVGKYEDDYFSFYRAGIIDRYREELSKVMSLKGDFYCNPPPYCGD